ncbi:MAG: hypothetical protein M3381_02975 [Actinomycetota bacterium]|nr:hypothetical protein [Actinomycetota bacterium]
MYVLIGMVLIGALLFALWRMSGSASAASGGRTGGTARPTPPPARKPSRREPLPPDDNPDFLRELDRRARREEDPPS